MNKEWSEKNKEFQKLISKEATFKDGIKMLLELRASVFEQITQIVDGYPEKAFYEMPFAGADGYHSKTLAYSIWHIFRIEDIVCHTLILQDKQVLECGNWQKKTGTDIITTGNELAGQKIAEFSKKLGVKTLYEYAKAVKDSTNEFLQSLEYSVLKQKFTEEDRNRVAACGGVSSDENAVWLIDYWCGKDVRGLLKMPFSRHWIMHVEAMCRIKNQLCKKARKGVDPIAYCGFSCNHCFLSQWCGSCRTEYNTCSFATCSPDGICPNTKCCKDKGFDGCWECSEIENCKKGFYIPECDGAAAAKAQALFVGKYGKNEFLKLQDKFHKEYKFSKTQEILGQDMKKGFEILEKFMRGEK